MRDGLTINADDFGIDLGRDCGIWLLSFLRFVDSISAFAVGRYTEADALRHALRRFRPDLKIGLHVDLTDGPFQTEAMRRLHAVRTYQDKRHFWSHAVAGEVSQQHVADEVWAQINLFQRSFGFVPDHLDGHNHVHIAHPQIYLAFVDIQSQLRLPALRLPVENLSSYQIVQLSRLDEALPPDPVIERIQRLLPSAASLVDIPLADLVDRMRRSALCDTYLYQAAVRRLKMGGTTGDCQQFYGTYFGFLPSISEVRRIVRSHRSSHPAEFMVHPGLNIFPGKKTSFSSGKRAVETLVLLLGQIADEAELRRIKYCRLVACGRWRL
jgi:YdjC-like protein